MVGGGWESEHRVLLTAPLVGLDGGLDCGEWLGPMGSVPQASFKSSR